MVTLRDYVATDAERLVELANNPRVTQYLIYTFPYPYTRQDAELWIAHGSKVNGAVTKVIESHGVFVGSIAIAPQDGWKNHSAEIGYWLGETYWGQGIATTALAQMNALAFSNTHCTKLFAPVLGPNTASMRVLEKCGYVLEGIFKNDVCKNGQFFDGHYFAKHKVTDH